MYYNKKKCWNQTNDTPVKIYSFTNRKTQFVSYVNMHFNMLREKNISIKERNIILF